MGNVDESTLCVCNSICKQKVAVAFSNLVMYDIVLCIACLFFALLVIG